jgi:hypothetical protein
MDDTQALIDEARRCLVLAQKHTRRALIASTVVLGLCVLNVLFLVIEMLAEHAH